MELHDIMLLELHCDMTLTDVHYITGIKFTCPNSQAAATTWLL